MAESSDERPESALELSSAVDAEEGDNLESVALDEVVEQEGDSQGLSNGVEQSEGTADIESSVEHHINTAADAEDTQVVEEEADVLSPPAIPSKDQAEARSSIEDPAAFQDVSLAAESQQIDDQQQQQRHGQDETPTDTSSSASAQATSLPPTPERSRSGTTSSSGMNGSPASANASAGAQPVRPGVAPVRSSRASSTYSTRTASTSAANRKPLLQGVLVVSAFETILSSKDARRTPALKDAAQNALDILKAPSSQTSSVHTGEDRRREVLEPLRLACETKTNSMMITALDAIGKLVSYGFFNSLDTGDDNSIAEEGIAKEETSQNGPSASTENVSMPDEQTRQLSDLVVDTICDCFIESPPGPAAAALQAASNTGPDAVNLQIVKALLTLVLQDSNNKGLSIHQSALVSVCAHCCSCIPTISQIAKAHPLTYSSCVYAAQSRTYSIQYLPSVQKPNQSDDCARCSQSNSR